METLHIRRAWANQTSPESKAPRVGPPLQKVVVMLRDEKVLFQCWVPQQLAANLTVREIVGVGVHVMQAGLQIRHLLARQSVYLEVDHRTAVLQCEQDRRWHSRPGRTVNVLHGLSTAQVGPDQTRFL